jgi:hypothetical protein
MSVKIAKSTRLLANPLPAILALNSLLNYRIFRNPIIHIGNKIQRQTNTDEIKALVEKCAMIAVRNSTLLNLLKLLRAREVAYP